MAPPPLLERGVFPRHLPALAHRARHDRAGAVHPRRFRVPVAAAAEDAEGAREEEGKVELLSAGEDGGVQSCVRRGWGNEGF